MPTKVFGTVRPKSFDGKIWYPLLCIKFFDTSIFLKHWRDAHKIFRHCETKIFRRKIVIPPIVHKNFSIPQFFKKIQGMLKKFFGRKRQKNFRQKTVIPPIMHKFFQYLKVSETLKGCPQNFRHCETKKFRRENVIPLSMHRFFQYPNFSQNIEGMLTKFFGTVRPKYLEAKTWYALFHP